jgi:glycosyltransferase involved in cell wall biosynthesis
MSARTSVIMPVRNGARFIAAALASVLPQLAGDDEVLVVDDASTDATRETVAAVDDPRLRVLAGLGRGVSAARNLGLAAASGDFVAFLDHDDMWPAGRHAVLMRALAAAPAYGCAGGRVRLKVESDAIMPRSFADIDGQLRPMFLCSLLFRRWPIDRAGAFAEDMRFGEDIDFLLRLREAGCRTLAVDADTLIYRRHDANVTLDRIGVEDGFMQVLRQRRLRMRGRSDAKG